MGEAIPMQDAGFPPHRVEEVIADVFGRELGHRLAFDVLSGQRHRAVGKRGEHLEIGAGRSAPAGHEQHQRFMFDFAFERPAGPLVGRVLEQQSSVAPVQHVGVAAVAVVDLHERSGAAGRGHRVQLGAPTVGAPKREVGHVDAGFVEGGDHGDGRRTAVGRPERDQQPETPDEARRDREEQADQARCAGDRDDEHERDERQVAHARRQGRGSHGLPTTVAPATAAT